MDAKSSSSQSTNVITVQPASPSSPFDEGEGKQTPRYYTTTVNLTEEEKAEEKINEGVLIAQRASEYYRGDFVFDGVERQEIAHDPEAMENEFNRALDIFIRKKLFNKTAENLLEGVENLKYSEARAWLIKEIGSGKGVIKGSLFSAALFPPNSEATTGPVFPGGRALIDFNETEGFTISQRVFRPIVTQTTPPVRKGFCNLYMHEAQNPSIASSSATYFLEMSGLKEAYVTNALRESGAWVASDAKSLETECYNHAHFPHSVSDAKVTPESLAALYEQKQYAIFSDDQRLKLHEFVSAALPKSVSDRLLKGKIAEYIGRQPTEELVRKFYFESYYNLPAPQKRDFNKLAELTEPKAHSYFEIVDLLNKFGYAQVTQENLSHLYKNKYKMLPDAQRAQLHQLIVVVMPKHESDTLLKGKIAEYLGGQQPTEESLRKFYFEKYPYLSISEKQDFNQLVELTDPKHLEYLNIAAGRGLGFWARFAIIFGERGKLKWGWPVLLTLGVAALVASNFTVGLWLLVGGISAVALALAYFSTIVLKQTPRYYQDYRKQFIYAPEDVPFAVRFQQKFNEQHGVWKALATIFLVGAFLITAFSVAGVLGAFPDFFANLPNLVFNTSAATFAVAGAISMILVLIAHTLNTWLGSEPGGEKNHVLTAGGSGNSGQWAFHPTEASRSLSSIISAPVSTSALANANSSPLVDTSVHQQDVITATSSTSQHLTMSAAATPSIGSDASSLPNVPDTDVKVTPS